MSFIRALFSGVSGIKGHQTMMDVIGNNIANINTIGFKAGRATFAETFSQTLNSATAPPGESASGVQLLRGGTNPMQIGLGTSIGSIDNLFAQGTLQSTGQTTDLAVEGEGMFAARIGDNIYYTRAGNFVVDGEGRLIHPSTGGFLLGRLANEFGTFPAGSDTVPGADLLDDLRINRNQKAASKQTSEVSFLGNLDAASHSVDNGAAPITVTSPMYDSLGDKWNLTMTFEKTTELADGQQIWTWTLQTATREDSTEDGGLAIIDIGESGDITFNEDGSINDDGFDPETPIEIDFAGFGGTLTPITLNFGTENPDFDPDDQTTWGPYDGVTGFASQNSIAVHKQDGYGSGLLEDFFVDQNGKITGKFSNGTTLVLAQVMLANFDNVGGLEKVGNNLFAETGNSGAPIFSEAGKQTSTRIRGGTLEQSNVDLTEEFTNLILAQRGFQSNAKVVTTSDELIQDLINMKR